MLLAPVCSPFLVSFLPTLPTSPSVPPSPYQVLADSDNPSDECSPFLHNRAWFYSGSRPGQDLSLV